MRWLALSDVERQAMSDRAIAMFQDCYDMRRNTEAILRLFESARASKTIEQHQERTEAQS
jgi:hypothetical protein